MYYSVSFCIKTETYENKSFTNLTHLTNEMKSKYSSRSVLEVLGFSQLCRSPGSVDLARRVRETGHIKAVPIQEYPTIKQHRLCYIQARHSFCLCHSHADRHLPSLTPWSLLLSVHHQSFFTTKIYFSRLVCLTASSFIHTFCILIFTLSVFFQRVYYRQHVLTLSENGSRGWDICFVTNLD